MTAVYIISCVILIIFLLLFLPITLVIRYNTSLSVYARILFIKIPISPGKKKRVKLSDFNEKKLKKQKDKQQKKMSKKQLGKKEEKKRTFSDISELVEIIYDTVYAFGGKFSDHLKIKIANIDIAVGTDNSAKTAIIFGAVNAAAQALISLLSSFSSYKDRYNENIRIRADFLSEKTFADIDIRFGTNLFGVLASLIHSMPKIKKLIDKI